MNALSAKKAIFDSIRQNLADSLPNDAVYKPHSADKQDCEESGLISNADENPAEIFRENLSAIGARCEIVENSGEAGHKIKSVIEEKKAKKIAISDADTIIKIVEQINADFIRNASKEELFDCDIGITSAQFGIAETGTLVIETDKEFNRLTSLVPPVHICVLEISKLRRTLSEVLDELQRDLSRSIAFITGQSRTSDIELTLALGVHGPGELIVFLKKS